MGSEAVEYITHSRLSDHHHTWTRIDGDEVNVLGVWKCPCGAIELLWVQNRPHGEYHYGNWKAR